MAIPTFWIGTLFILLFSLHWQVFPSSGYGTTFREHLSALFLPALTLSLWQAGLLIRNLRSAVIDVIRLPYVDFARIRGLRESTVLRRHVLRTSLGSTVTIIGVNVGFLLAGAVIVENVFSVPGIGIAARRVGVQPRLQRRAGHHARLRGDRRGDQPRDRPDVSAARPAGGAG